MPQRLNPFPVLRMNNLRALCPVFLLVVGVARWAAAESAFVHPGLLHDREDLQRMRSAVRLKEEPAYSGFEVFRSNEASSARYVPRGPLERVGRNPTVGQGAYDSDANAAYQCALMWAITGEKVYAEKSKQILNAWSSTLTSITGRDAVLMAGLGPFKMVNAAEIIRYTDADWSEADIRKTEAHFRTVVYPVIKDFAPFANGNWDAAAIKTVMAIGVFCNDREMFERGLRYYLDGSGNGCLRHYIINDSGQCQESGRDQQHTQLGLALLADSCEIAWHQGIDLYGYDDNRLLKGFEYTARYNLGKDVPFEETLDRTGKYHHTRISTEGRGQLRAVFEQVYNHYVNRRGIAAPYTQQAAARVRPEGPGRPGADHPGFGTLLYTRRPGSGAPDVSMPPQAPAGILASAEVDAIQLDWVPSLGATEYQVKRAQGADGFRVVGKAGPSASFTDRSVKAGEVYRYTVSAVNASGESADAFARVSGAGLPRVWRHQDIGATALRGNTRFDGRTFVLEGAGRAVGGTRDECQFACVALDGDGTVAARFVPQTSSQVSAFGLMMRESLEPNAANVALLISPVLGKDVEAPGWRAGLVVRGSAGAASEVQASSARFGEPMVTFGRMTGPCWLRLVRSGNDFVGLISPDGRTWKRVGTVRASLKRQLQGGLAVCSGLAEVTTAVAFDSVLVPGWQPSAFTAGRAPTEPADSRHAVQSPDSRIGVHFLLQADGSPAYRIDYLGKPVVLESRMGFDPGFTNQFEALSVQSRSHAGQWTNQFGERRVVPDNYRELMVNLKHSSGRLLTIAFRAYDEGAAFRYEFPQQPDQSFNFTGEQTEFRFPEGVEGYEEHGTEGEYRRMAVAKIQPGCERPLTLEYADGRFASLTEAANFDYPRMLLSPLAGVPGALVSALGGETANTGRRDQRHDPGLKRVAGESSPWRVFVVGDKPGDLLERNYLILNLNPPSSIADTSWIKPGKVIRETTLSTTGAIACVDFAAQHGLQYVHFDTGWYGPERSDPDATAVDPTRDLDLQRVIDHGASKGVGVILYVNKLALRNQIDVLPALYRQWGVKGMKFGFVDVGPASETAWITDAIRTAADQNIMVNIHDGYRATGNNRTWPNLMTVEGIRGNEHMPTSEHNCTLPFTRYVGGVGDYTVCYYSHRIKTTHAHQLAMAVVSFSPLQWLFWYDKPSDYHGEPEIAFFREVPTVWDETRVLLGDIGRFASIARRSGEDWFVGTINNSEPRELELSLSFLKPGVSYTARIYSDDDLVRTATKVRVTSAAVDSRTTLRVPLKPSGGQAVWITPEAKR